MAAPKGHPRYGGRKKGVPNKLTQSAKEAFQFAFTKIGGAEDLASWALENKTEFYKLFARLIPTEVEGGVDNTLTIKIVRFGDARASQ